MAVDWGYYDKFETVMEKYLPERGEGKTKATQIITAVNKLIYKWYNDGDVYDNTHILDGWCNNLSSYANWLYNCITDTQEIKFILNRIEDCITESDYEDLLKALADKLFDENYLAEQDKVEKIGTIYNCYGKFKFVEKQDDENYWE